MACDPVLADQLREALVGHDVTEKRMFGGLAFLLDGRLAVAASGQGGLLVRVPPEQTAALREEPGVDPFVMRDREMDGWLRVSAEVVDDEDALCRWVATGRDAARRLPAR